MTLATRPSFFGHAGPLLGVALLGLTAALPAAAQTTLVDTHTLNGTFFYDPMADIISIGQAQAYIASNSPTGTFTASQSVLTNPSGYSSRDSSTAQAFLGSDGASYAGATTNLQDGIFDFKGYLNVTTPNTYTFSTGSDDGSALFIDGSEVVNNDIIAPERFVSGTETLGTGLHPVELVYYNHVYGNGGGYANLTADFGGLSVTNSNLADQGIPASPAPEPSAIAIWAFVGLGAAGMALKARKHKASAI